MAAFAPSYPGCDSAEHTGFGGADGQGSGLPFVGFRRVPQVCHYVYAFPIHYGNTRILGFVNIIYVYGFIHKPGCVLVHICGYKCSQIKTRLSLGECFVFNHLVGNLRGCGALRILSTGAGCSMAFEPNTLVLASPLRKFVSLLGSSMLKKFSYL